MYVKYSGKINFKDYYLTFGKTLENQDSDDEDFISDIMSYFFRYSRIKKLTEESDVLESQKKLMEIVKRLNEAGDIVVSKGVIGTIGNELIY